MKNRLSLIFATVIWFVLIGVTAYQIVDYLQFRSAGKRFTAEDGQKLCLRIQALETNLQPCEYDQP